MRDDTIGYQIRLIHNEIHKRMEAKRIENEGEPLTGMQRWILGYLSKKQNEGVYQRTIEEEFHISRATASNMISVMERRGLVLRQSVEHDARLKRLVLTELGQSLIDRANQDISQMEALLTKGFSKEEVTALKHDLKRIADNLRAMEKNT